MWNELVTWSLWGTQFNTASQPVFTSQSGRPQTCEVGLFSAPSSEAVLPSSTRLGGNGDGFQSGTAEDDPARAARTQTCTARVVLRGGWGREGRQVFGSLPPGCGQREEPPANHPRPSVPTEKLSGTLKRDQTR